MSRHRGAGIQYSPNQFPERRVRMCVPCKQAGVQAVATRLVAVTSPDGRKKQTPMCTRHAQAAWKPEIGSVAEITVEGELARYPREE